MALFNAIFNEYIKTAAVISFQMHFISGGTQQQTAVLGDSGELVSGYTNKENESKSKRQILSQKFCLLCLLSALLSFRRLSNIPCLPSAPQQKRN